MRVKITILLLMFFFVATNLAQTNISGTISSDSTLSIGGSPFIVTGTLKLNNGSTLTVDPNVEVRFKTGTRLYVYGVLVANSAVFTSSADTIGGTPARGDWGNIQIGDYYNTGSAHFSNCQIKYGGNSDNANLYLYKGTATLDTTSLSQSKNYGIRVYNGGTINITGSSISNCSSVGLNVNNGVTANITNSTIQTCDWPIMYEGTASVVFNGINDFTGNNYDGIYIYNNAHNTMTWDTVAIPYVLRTDFTINDGETLTVASNNVVKSMGGRLYVNGTLNALASVGETIYFTSYKNDNLMGDTNNDGSTTGPAQSDWYGIYFRDQSDDATNVMTRCEVSFAGRGNTGAITTDDASPTITNCTLANNYFGAMFIGLSNPTFSDNVIGSSELVPVALSFEASPVFTNNSFSNSDNEYDAIGILSGTLRGNAVLPQRNFTSISNVTYLLLGNVNVPLGITLTINEGIVIKSYNSYHRLIIAGKLIADGTDVAPIVFTSAKDDSYGNPKDTNKDGTVSVPAKENWGGITFENGSDPTSLMDNCKVLFASMPWYGYYINQTYIYSGALTLINSSPTISNCTFKDVIYGIYAFSTSNPIIENCKFQNSTYTPILMSVSANPTFSGNTFTNSGVTALGISPEHLPTSGTIAKRNVATYDNITYALMGDLYINSGSNVTVEPGVVIKVWNNTGIYVEGGFKADGGLTGNIVFTSIKDDNFGNPFDTNGDGNATFPAINNWKTIQFKSTSDDVFSMLDSCSVKFGGSGSLGGVTYTDAAASITNSTISDSYYGIKCEGSSTPNIDWVTIQNCDYDPIAMSLKSNPTFTNITFAANGSSGIKILEGTLSSDATLAKRSIAGISNIAYIVDNLTISPSAILTIEPGVVIKFNSTYYYSITVQGALVANGTLEENIVFTSIRDDSNGGDTNNDGNNSSPDKGNWRDIQFQASTLDTLNSLKHCSIRYGGNSSYLYDYNWGAVRIFSSKLKMDSCIVEQSSSTGIGVFGSANPIISNTQINNITYTPIAMSMFSNPTFSNNNALNIGIMALGIANENYSVDATVPIRNFAGFNNITYYLYGTSTVNSGTKIVIPAGVVFKNGRLNVNGALKINGTIAEPVVFTDLKDDSYGNPMDTNDDGSATLPSISGTRIQFYDVSDDANSTFDYAIFKYSDVAIWLDQASPTLTNQTFNRNNWGVYLTGVSNPVLNYSIFNDLTYAAFRTSLVSYPSSTIGNIISGTTYKAIGVLESETLVQDVTLLKRNFGGITNIPYLFHNYTVASNAILTIEPGVVLKFFPYTKLTIRKGLQAIGGGTPDSTIVFTDIRDDFYGGDSNSDSTETTPWSSSQGWHGIYFEEESLDPLCKLNYCVVQYAGHYYYNDRGAVVTTNASPTITNSTFKYNYSTLVAKGSSNPTINFCDIYQNSGLGINNVNKSFTINAENNWWGNDSGPKHSTNIAGVGAEVTDAVDFTPWLGGGASNPVMGDVSLNGTVQAFDASKILKFVVNPTGDDSLNSRQRSVADVSATAGITSYDASLILQYSVGLITSFPAEVGSSPAPPVMDDKTKQYLALQKVDNVSLSISGSTVNRAEQFSIPIEISNSKGVTALQIEIDVNTKLYSLKDLIEAKELSEFNVNYAFNESTKKLIIAIAGTKPMDLEGNILTLNLLANEEIRGNVSEEIKISKFLANENNLTKNVISSPIQFVGKPTAYGLEQNYPNPFNPSTIITYQIPDDNVNVKLIIYNIKGEVVKTLVNLSQNAGTYNITWNATNNYGGKVSTGVYIYRITANKYTATKKLMVLK